jgi:hypothetical protein
MTKQEPRVKTFKVGETVWYLKWVPGTRSVEKTTVSKAFDVDGVRYYHLDGEEDGPFTGSKVYRREREANVALQEHAIHVAQGRRDKAEADLAQARADLAALKAKRS